MISNFKIAKALRDRAKVVADANSYPLVTNGQNYQNDADGLYIEESVLFGDDNSIGISDNSSNIQIGIYQLSVNIPKNKTKWTGLEVIDVLKASFTKGLELTHDGQTLRIKNLLVSPISRTAAPASMFDSETHYVYNLSIEYSVIG